MTVSMKQNRGRFTSPILILVSAAIFGFFGFFYADWNKPFPDGQVVLFMVLLGWTLRISAIVFLAAGLLAFVSPIAGNLLYALTGVATAGLFVVVSEMDGRAGSVCGLERLRIVVGAAVDHRITRPTRLRGGWSGADRRPMIRRW